MKIQQSLEFDDELLPNEPLGSPRSRKKQTSRIRAKSQSPENQNVSYEIDAKNATPRDRAISQQVSKYVTLKKRALRNRGLRGVRVNKEDLIELDNMFMDYVKSDAVCETPKIRKRRGSKSRSTKYIIKNAKKRKMRKKFLLLLDKI